MNPDDPAVQKLREAAEAALQHAYCRYSKFPVAAAVLSTAGEIFAGCNVENASYGLTMCAERSAIFQAVARGHRQFKAIVVVTPTAQPTPPCGACRQVINEFSPEAEIFSFGRDNTAERFQMSELLPHAFGPQNLD